MGKKVGLFVLCLMLVCFALVGAAEGKQKAVVADKVPLLMYCPEEGKDDPEFQSYWGIPFEISPPGKYDMQVEFLGEMKPCLIQLLQVSIVMKSISTLL